MSAQDNGGNAFPTHYAPPLCDKCGEDAPRRVAIHADSKPPLMLCPGCYAAFDFDAMEDKP